MIVIDIYIVFVFVFNIDTNINIDKIHISIETLQDILINNSMSNATCSYLKTKLCHVDYQRCRQCLVVQLSTSTIALFYFKTHLEITI